MLILPVDNHRSGIPQEAINIQLHADAELADT
jgi:hypothetical protein